MVKYLVEHEADVNKENKSGKTPLFNAYRGGYETIVKYLVKHGANTNKEKNIVNEILLFNTYEKGNETIAECFNE